MSQLRLPFRHFGTGNSFYTIIAMRPNPQRQKAAPSRPVGKTEKTETKTCLITGFGPFGENRFNPSGRLVCDLPERTRYKAGSLLLKGAVLPHCCSDAWRQLKQLLEEHQPELLLLTGLAQRRQILTIERFALNIRDYRTADERGHLYRGQPIDQIAPIARRSALPLEEIKGKLERKGFPCEISNHAGTFICNDLYFRAMSCQTEQGGPTVLFVHLPKPKSYGSSVLAYHPSAGEELAKSRSAQMAHMTDAVLALARICATLAESRLVARP